jgi:hypothetical protein
MLAVLTWRQSFGNVISVNQSHAVSQKWIRQISSLRFGAATSAGVVLRDVAAPQINLNGNGIV